MAKRTGATATPPETVTKPEAPAASESASTETDGDLNALSQLISDKLTPPEKPTEATPPDDAGDALSQAPESGKPEPEPARAGDGEDEPGEDTVTDDTKPEDEGDEEPKGLTPEAQQAFNKRIAKEVERRKALEAERDEALAKAERVAELEAEAAGLREQLTAPDDTPAHPWLAKAKTEAEMAKVEAEARKHERWADRQLERLKFKPIEVEAALRAEKAQIEDWTEEGMADYLLRLKEGAQDLLEAVPKQRQKLEGQRAYATAEKAVVEKFKPALPWLADRKSDEFARIEQIASRIPGLKARPEWPVLAAMLAEGGRVIEARMAKKPAPTAVTRKPAAPGKPSAEPAPINVLAAQAQAAKKTALETGNEKDIARYLERVL